METQQHTIQSSLSMLRLVTVMMAISVLVYIWVGYTSAGSAGAEGPSDASILLIPFSILGAITFFATPKISTLVFKSSIRVFEQPSMSQLCRAYSTATIVALALLESIAIYGLVLTFETGDLTWVIAFGVVSLYGIYLHRPRMEHLKSYHPDIHEQSILQ